MVRTSRSRLVFGLVLATAFGGPASTQVRHGPVEDDLNNHYFYSIPEQAAIPEATRIRYRVCNRSDKISNFFWRGAGWGVFAWRPLRSDICAFKRVQATDLDTTRRLTDVSFHGQTSGSVGALVFDDPQSGFLRRAWTYISQVVLPASEQDGFETGEVRLEISASRDQPDDAHLKLQSPQLDEIVIVLPQVEMDEEQASGLVELWGGNVDVIFQNAPREALADVWEELDSGFTIDANGFHPTFLLRPNQDGFIVVDVRLLDPDAFGNVMSVFGRQGSRTMLQDTVPIPMFGGE